MTGPHHHHHAGTRQGVRRPGLVTLGEVERAGALAVTDLSSWATSIDRAIQAGLAYLEAERRLRAWQEAARCYALPSGVAEERISQSQQLLARRSLEVMLAEALEVGHRPT